MSPRLGSDGGPVKVKEVRSVRNACALLETVAAHQPVGVSELARLTGIDKSAVQRLAVTLHAAGWLQPHPRPPTRWEISHTNPLVRAGATLGLEALAKPAMERLRDRSGETVILVVPQGDRLVIAAAVESHQPIRLSPTVGFVLPQSGSASATAIAAHSRSPDHDDEAEPDATETERRRVRIRGWATNDGEVTEGVRAVSSAVLDTDGQPVGALAVCGPSTRIDQDDLPRLGAMVADAAQEVFTKRPEPPR
jgi:DNA-binding IclR family transcriptional regulator